MDCPAHRLVAERICQRVDEVEFTKTKVLHESSDRSNVSPIVWLDQDYAKHVIKMNGEFKYVDGVFWS